MKSEMKILDCCFTGVIVRNLLLCVLRSQLCSFQAIATFKSIQAFNYVFQAECYVKTNYVSLTNWHLKYR